MHRRSFRVLAGLAMLVSLALAEGCYYHHQNGGYHRDFAYYTPEHTSGFRSARRSGSADRDYIHMECR